MRKVKDAVDLSTKEKIYFKGHAKATYLSDGRSVEEAINSGVGGGYDDTEIRQELTNVNATALEAHELATLANERIDAIEIEVPEVDLSEINQSLDKIESELTELSAEVSGLSEKIDNLPSAEDEILKVEYGKTTFQEIKDAYVAGKYIVFEYVNNVFHINRVTDTEIYFVSINGALGYRVGLNNKNNWYQNVYPNEQSSNKVTSLSDKSTDTQYPSAKAVYDFVNNTLGTIINGDY